MSSPDREVRLVRNPPTSAQSASPQFTEPAQSSAAKMLGNRPAQESELVGPICARFGLTVESSRLLISEGRKVGFVVDCGALPQSVRCFVEEFPTPSTSLERNTSRGKALCLLPKGFKVVGLVEGSVYLGEVVYDENWKRSYKFHLVEGADIVKSSMPCSNPTSAFKEIEAVIKVHTTKKRQRKPDARSNGKLYMAVMYSATQRLLREKFRGCENKVPEDVRPIFIEWMENRATNKSMGGLHDATVVPMALSMNPVSKPNFALPRHSSAPGSRGMPHSRETYSDHLAPTTTDLHTEGHDSYIGEQHSYEVIPDGPEQSMRRRASRSFDDYRLRSYSAGMAPSNGYEQSSLVNSRKRGSGSIDETSPVPLNRKRASGSIDEDSPIYKEFESMQQQQQQHAMQGPPPPPPGGPPPSVALPASLRLADAGELFADCFRLPGEDFLSHSITSPSGSSFLGDSATIGDMQNPFATLASHDDLHALMQPVTPPAKVGQQAMTTDLFHCLRDPDRYNLTPIQLRGFIAIILQVPADNISTKHIDDIVYILQRSGRNVSLDSFTHVLESQEHGILEQFHTLDRSGKGEITIEELRTAYTGGQVSAPDLDMEEMQLRMDSLNVGRNGAIQGSGHGNRMMTFDEFKNLVLPLPPAATLKAAIEMARREMDSLDVDLFNF